MAESAAYERLSFRYGIRAHEDADTASEYHRHLAAGELRKQGRTLEDLTEGERPDYDREKAAYVRACVGMGRQPGHEREAAESATLIRTLADPEGRRRYHEAIADLHRSIAEARRPRRLESRKTPAVARVAPRSRERSARPAARRAASSSRGDSGDDGPGSPDGDLAWLRGLARILSELDREEIEHDLSAVLVPGALCIVLGREEVSA